MDKPLHLQTEKPVMKWEDWYVALCKLYAEAEKIPLNAVSRRINIDIAKEWYDDGFTPYVCFREDYQGDGEVEI